MMKPLITNIDTWSKYRQIDDEVWRGGRNEVQGAITQSLRELFERETILSPADLSHELVRELLIMSCKKAVPSFVADSNNKNVIELIVQYIRKDEVFIQIPGYSFTKGLLIRGNIGTGKTVLFKGYNDLTRSLRFFAFLNYHHRRSDPITFYKINATEISEAFSLDGFEIFTRNVVNRKTSVIDFISQALFIDDLGAEPIANHFGASVNIIAELLIRRYEKAKITHAASNLDPEALKKLYGMRVFDRMKEMFNDIILPGESRRK